LHSISTAESVNLQLIYKPCSCIIQVAIGEPGKQKFYPFHAGSYEVFKKTLLSKFPKEEKAIDKFIQLLKVATLFAVLLLLLKELHQLFAIIKIINLNGYLICLLNFVLESNL
jgi:hypothetical protein